MVRDPHVTPLLSSPAARLMVLCLTSDALRNRRRPISAEARRTLQAVWTEMYRSLSSAGKRAYLKRLRLQDARASG